MIASDVIVATTSSVKEAKFQPHAPLSHISLDAYPSVQVRVGWVGKGGFGSGQKATHRKPGVIYILYI